MMKCKTIELDQIVNSGSDEQNYIINILKCQNCKKISFPPFSKPDFDGYLCGNCVDISKEICQKVVFSPIEKISLSKIIVACPRSKLGCEVKYNYKDALDELPNHIQKCQFSSIICEYCQLPVFMGELKVHIDEACEGKYILCDVCHIKFDIRFPHNCVQALFIKNENLCKEIKDLKTIVEELKKVKPSKKKRLKKKESILKKKKEKLLIIPLHIKREDEVLEYRENGLTFMKNCQYKEALSSFNESLNLSIIKNGDISIEIAECYFYLGLVYEELSQYSKAFEKYNSCREITEKVEGIDTLNYANIMSKIGNIWKLQNDFLNAEICFKKGLDIRMKLGGQESKESIDSMNQLSRLFFEKGDYEKSNSFLKTSSKIKEEKCNFDLGYADIMTIIGDIYYEKGEYNLSLLHFEKALLIRDFTLGHDHLDTANAYNSIGFIYLYDDNENSEKSLFYFQKALEIKKKLSKKEYSLGLGDIAIYYCIMDNHEMGLKYYLEGLNLLIKLFGENHIETGKFYCDIGYRVYLNTNEIDKSIDFLLKGLKINQEVLGNTHILVANAYFFLGYAYLKQEDFEKAIESYNKALTIRSYLLGEDHLETADCYFALGEVYYDTNYLEKSIEYINTCLDIRKKKLSINSLEIAECEISLGNAYKNMKDYKVSLSYYENIEKNYPQNEKNGKSLANVFSSMGIIYNELKMNLLSIEYHKKALNLFIKYYSEESVNVINTYYNIAVCNLEMKRELNYTIEILSKGIEYSKKLFGELNLEAATLLDLLGDVYLECDNIKKGRIAYLEALETLNNTSEKTKISQIAFKLGEIYKEEKKFHRALEYYEISQQNEFSVSLIKVIQKLKNELREEEDEN